MSVVTPVAPDRTTQQRMEALEHANEIRTQRAQLKDRIKERPRRAAEVIAEPPEWAVTMRVYDLLRAVPRIGRVKADAILRRYYISPAKTLGGLTDRQRKMLLLVMGERGLWP